MNLFPHYSEILVSSLSADEVNHKLASVTQRIDYLDVAELRQNKDILFNGVLDKNGFKISLRIDKADSFLPLIKGKIETTNNGCILFLDYSLFPSSVFFLGFWGVVTMALFLFFLFSKSPYLFAASSMVVGIGNFAFAWGYFGRKVKQSRKIFNEILGLKN